jgi:hypothetical protein
MACPDGTEWVVAMNSHSKGPSRTRPPSGTGLNRVRPTKPASSMRLRARPSVKAEP